VDVRCHGSEAREHALVCYHGSAMSKRAGNTTKISISVQRSDLVSLKKRARRLYGGNVSAVIAELAADAALLEGMNDLVARLGGPILTEEDGQRLDREWAAPASALAANRRTKKGKNAA